MEIRKTLYVTERKDWRKWLSENHGQEKDIWLIFYKKASGKPRISYNDAVEEALCYGWIDSIAKKIDEEKFAQRFSPRTVRSQLSEMNKQRILKLIAEKKMTKSGLDAVSHLFDPEEQFIFPEDILQEIKKEKQAWENFQKLPEGYKRIRIAYIEHVRKRSEKEFKKRLNHFIRLTAKNKKFGYVKEMK